MSDPIGLAYVFFIPQVADWLSAKTPESCGSWGRIEDISVPRDAQTSGGPTTTYEGCDRMSKRICSVPECNRKHRTNGLCSMHYSRFRRTGKTENSHKWVGMSPLERFWDKVDRGSDSECWEWTGARSPLGYGRFRAGNRTVNAHRWLWEQMNGTAPQDMVLDHFVCDNPPCVNPAHLVLTTTAGNVLRGKSPAANHARKTECHKGHPLLGDNLYLADRTAQGRGIERVCVICATERNRARYAKN